MLKRAGVPPASVGQVVGGCINKVGAQAMNVTRTAWLTAGGAADVACSTVDSQCGSSQYAVNLAASLIASGAEDVVLACGVENMSLLPIGSDAIAGAQAGYGKPISRKYREHFEFVSQFEGAERIATKYGITREDTDVSASNRSSARRGRSKKAASNRNSCRSRFPFRSADGEKTGEMQTGHARRSAAQYQPRSARRLEAGRPSRRDPHRRLRPRRSPTALRRCC